MAWGIFWQEMMATASGLRGVFSSVYLCAFALFLILIWWWPTAASREYALPSAGSSQLAKFLLWKTMEQNHAFVAASYPLLRVQGRWITSANQLRQDAAFPGKFVLASCEDECVLRLLLTSRALSLPLTGSCIELVVTNTTVVYLQLNNLYMLPGDSSATGVRDNRQTVMLPVDLRAPPGPVSLLVEVNEAGYQAFDSAAGLLLIARDLDPSRTYCLRVTYLGGVNNRTDPVQFEGIWLDKPEASHVSDPSRPQLPPQTQQLLNPLLEWPLPRSHSKRLLSYDSRQTQQRRKTIEILTCEAPNTPFSTTESAATTSARLSFWPNLFRRDLALDVVTIPTDDAVLATVKATGTSPTVPAVFFHAGPPSSPHATLPWPFRAYTPSLLLLQVGVADYRSFFAHAPDANSHALRTFTTHFVAAYVDLVTAIRKTAYPYHSPASAVEFHQRGSYAMSSGPSTLPIFLVPPFASVVPDRLPRLQDAPVPLDLHATVAAALQQVVDQLRVAGDLSTHAIDTSGWIDPATDFLDSDAHPSGNVTPASTDRASGGNWLTRFANYKVASLLHSRLCAYLQDDESPCSTGLDTDTSSMLAQDGEDDDDDDRDECCPFERYEDYLGSVYVPADAEFEKMLLERKIELLKEAFFDDAA